MICQVREDYLTRGQCLAPYISWVQELLADFEYYTITHILREQNEETESLAKLASFSGTRHIDFVLVEILIIPSIDG